jgi:enterochelin esterase family protein
MKGLWNTTPVFVLLFTASCSSEPQTWSALSKQLASMDPAARGPAIEAYISAHGGTPLIENQSRVVFLAQDVDGVAPRIVGDFNAWATTAQGYDSSVGTMTRIAETSWSYLEATAWTNARVEYVLLYQKEARADPFNKRVVQALAGPRGELRMPQWVIQPEIDDQSQPPAGQVSFETMSSKALSGTRRVWFYVPPGYEAAKDTLYPVVYFLDGGNYVERMEAPRILDRLIARKRIPPVIAVFSEPADRQEEYSRSAAWRTFVSSELVPLVDKRFRTFPSPDHRVIFGSSLAGYGAVDLAIEFPSVFGLCAAFAPPVQTATIIANQAKARTSALSIRFFVLGGVYDPMVDGARRLRTTLDDAQAAVTYLEVSEGHSAETFRGHIDEALKALLPAP